MNPMLPARSCEGDGNLTANDSDWDNFLGPSSGYFAGCTRLIAAAFGAHFFRTAFRNLRHQRGDKPERQKYRHGNERPQERPPHELPSRRIEELIGQRI